MKKAIYFPLLIIIFNSFVACSIFDEPETELEKLPPITQTGELNFGCLVNGDAVRIRNSMLMRAETQQERFIIRFTSTVDDDLWADQIKSFEFNMSDPLEVGVEYDLTQSDLYNIEYIEYLNGLPNCVYEANNTLSGYLLFSNIDRTNYIISGTFEFETVTQSCDTVTVTDGRFDLYYHPY